jgi:hypothetical protein
LTKSSRFKCNHLGFDLSSTYIRSFGVRPENIFSKFRKFVSSSFNNPVYKPAHAQHGLFECEICIKLAFRSRLHNPFYKPAHTQYVRMLCILCFNISHVRTKFQFFTVWKENYLFTSFLEEHWRENGRNNWRNAGATHTMIVRTRNFFQRHHCTRCSNSTPVQKLNGFESHCSRGGRPNRTSMKLIHAACCVT